MCSEKSVYQRIDHIWTNEIQVTANDMTRTSILHHNILVSKNTNTQVTYVVLFYVSQGLLL